MQRISPILWTKSLEETIDFYERVLGFKPHSNFPNFVSLNRGNVWLMFVLPQEEPEDCKDPENKEEFFPRPVLTGSLYIYMDNVDELWNSIKDKTKVITAIENREYMMRDFSIHDNNGYELVFSKDISN